MLVVETIARIRRERLGKGIPIKQIARELRVSPPTEECPAQDWPTVHHMAGGTLPRTSAHFSEDPPMLRLYDNHLSGNGYKPRLLLAHLGRAYERVEVDILKGETRTPEFLARNPNGRIPVLEFEDGACIAESNAILFYLAEDSRFLPSERLARALALQWLFFEQYSHEPCIAVARHWIQHIEMTEAQHTQLPAKQEGGRAALAVMERHLGEADWFGGDAMNIADFALYAYTHVAGEGGFDLADYPAVGAWLARVAAQPGHIPMNPAPQGVIKPADC